MIALLTICVIAACVGLIAMVITAFAYIFMFIFEIIFEYELYYILVIGAIIFLLSKLF